MCGKATEDSHLVNIDQAQALIEELPRIGLNSIKERPLPITFVEENEPLWEK